MLTLIFTPVGAFPFYPQLDSMDCGPACLQMVLKFHGRYYPLPWLRSVSFISREGVSLKGISKAAERVGLLRSGLTVIALTVLVVLGLAAVICCPERVEAPFVLQRKTVPLAVHAGAGKYVEAILVEDRQSIAVGDTLMVFRSDGDWRTTRQLRAWLREEDSDRMTVTVQNYPSIIAPVLSELRGIHEGLESYLHTNGVAEQVAALQREIDGAGRLSGSLQRQVDLYDRELGYKCMNVERARTMEAEELISKQEAEAIEEQTIGALRQREVLVAGDVQKVARPRLPPDGEGRVALCDEVLLALDAYPSREFGQLSGEVLTIDPVVQLDAEQRYGRLATVLLPNSLVLSYRRPLPYQYNLTGTARIITEERTLLERLLDQFLT